MFRIPITKNSRAMLLKNLLVVRIYFRLQIKNERFEKKE